VGGLCTVHFFDLGTGHGLRTANLGVMISGTLLAHCFGRYCFPASSLGVPQSLFATKQVPRYDDLPAYTWVYTATYCDYYIDDVKTVKFQVRNVALRRTGLG
jgi:hypothetical protein